MVGCEYPSAKCGRHHYGAESYGQFGKFRSSIADGGSGSHPDNRVSCIRKKSHSALNLLGVGLNSLQRPRHRYLQLCLGAQYVAGDFAVRAAGSAGPEFVEQIRNCQGNIVNTKAPVHVAAHGTHYLKRFSTVVQAAAVPADEVRAHRG